MATTKPLPNIPKHPDLATLPPFTPEASQHFNRLLAQALESENLSLLWLHHIEAALLQFTDALRGGNWVTGSRRRRLVSRTVPDSERPPTPPSKTAGPDVESLDIEVNEDVLALKALEDRIAASVHPLPSSSPNHMIVTLAPSDAGRHFPDLGVDFDLRPHREACVFTPSTFVLPRSLLAAQPDDAMFLAGFESWKDIYKQPGLDHIRIVGGTFAFRGVHARDDHTALTSVLRIGLYSLLSLQLELGLCKDMFVQLQYPAPQPRRLTKPSPTQPPTTEQPVTPKKKHNRGAASGLWGFLTKKTENRPAQAPLSVQVGTGTSGSPSASSPLSSHGFGLVRSFSQHIGLTASDRDIQDRSPRTSGVGAEVRPFTSLLHRLPSTVFSTSPDVTFSPPAFLSRLAKREESNDEQIVITGEERVALGSLYGWHESHEKDSYGEMVLGSKAFLRHQCITMLYTEHVPADPEPETQSKPSTKEKEKEREQNETDTTTASNLTTMTTTTTATTDTGMTMTTTGVSIATGVTDDTTTSVPMPTTLADTSLAAHNPPIPPPKSTKSCLAPRWRTFDFFRDTTLGDFVIERCQTAEEPCGRDGCKWKKGEHRVNWLHGKVKISGRTTPADEQPREEVDGDDAENDVIKIWATCKECKRNTEKAVLTDGAFLFSFGKFLELLVYSPSLAYLTPPPCEHTTSTKSPSARPSTSTTASSQALPSSRFAIIRHFQHHGQVFSLSLRPIEEDVYEIKVPRIQIVKGIAEVKKEESTPLPPKTIAYKSEEKDELRLEIIDWWMALKDHLSKLEDDLTPDTAKMKVKRLPSVPHDRDGDDDCEPSETKAKEQISDVNGKDVTPSKSLDVPKTLKPPEVEEEAGGSPGSHVSLASSRPPTPPDKPNPIDLLIELSHTFHQTEQNLYKLLAYTPSAELNDVRRRFKLAAQGAKKRLAAWQKKHMEADVAEFDSSSVDPEWWGPGSHLIPKSRVIIREKDWGSIIAHTLGSIEYHRELVNLSNGRIASLTAPPSTPLQSRRPTVNSIPSSLSITSAATSSSKRSTATLDPDYSDEAAWQAEDDDANFSAVISRKENSKEGAGLLSLVNVLSNQRTVESSPPSATSNGSIMGSSGVSSRFTSITNSASKLLKFGMAPLVAKEGSSSGVATPPTAWAKAELELNLKDARGEPIRAEDQEKLLDLLVQLDHDGQEDGHPKIISTPSSDAIFGPNTTPKSSPSKLAHAPSAVEEADERSITASIPDMGLGGTARTTNAPSTSVASVIGTEPTSHTRESTDATIGPPVPPKDTSTIRKTSPEIIPSLPASPLLGPSKIIFAGGRDSPALGAAPVTATTTGSISDAVASAFRSLIGGPAQSPPRQHLGLLALQSPSVGALYPPIDDRPHLKYDFTLGKKLKFSCTVYYARQFDFLRKRCGIEANGRIAPLLSDNDILRSLEKCVGWEAEGGKSRSSFLKTADDRFILKTLVNAWNVADLQVLLELAPSYFRHMDITANRASVLAKLMGFYTIEVQNLDPKSGSGTVKSKADILVMENLFWGMNIEPGRTFDLKGIAGRKVKTRHTSPSTHKDKEKEDESPDPDTSKGERRKVKPAAEKIIPPPTRKPLYDGEWIEGQQRALVLIDSHSQAVLQEGLRSDAEFLAKSNIMDYSLLLGLDQDRHQITCGLVDTIGSYTFAKTLEYKAKQGLHANSGKEITVVPPSEYQERFVNAMSSYFFACPDRWSKPVGHISDTTPEDLQTTL